MISIILFYFRGVPEVPSYVSDVPGVVDVTVYLKVFERCY